MLLERTELRLVKLGLGNVYVLTAGHSKDSQSEANYIEGEERHVPHSGWGGRWRRATSPDRVSLRVPQTGARRLQSEKFGGRLLIGHLLQSFLLPLAFHAFPLCLQLDIPLFSSIWAG